MNGKEQRERVKGSSHLFVDVVARGVSNGRSNVSIKLARGLNSSPSDSQSRLRLQHDRIHGEITCHYDLSLPKGSLRVETVLIFLMF